MIFVIVAKMGVLTANTTGEPITIQSFLINDASRGLGYYGSLKYILARNGRQILSNSTFTRETMSERKPLEVHIKINGEKRLVLNHYHFEKNEAIVFVIDNEGKLAVNAVPKKAARGFADRIRGMLSSRGSAADMETLITAAKPLKF